MKCKNCGSSWTVQNKIASTIKNCPFCGNAFLEDKTIGKLLNDLIQKNGLDILKNSEKINGILADYFPKYEKERKSIRDALKVGAGRMFYDIAMDSQIDISEKIALIRQKLIEDAWLADAACDYICTIFLEAINIDFPINKSNISYQRSEAVDSDLIIKDGTFKKYSGSKTTLFLPSTAHTIAQNAFLSNEALKEVSKFYKSD